MAREVFDETVHGVLEARNLTAAAVKDHAGREKVAHYRVPMRRPSANPRPPAEPGSAVGRAAWSLLLALWPLATLAPQWPPAPAPRAGRRRPARPPPPSPAQPAGDAQKTEAQLEAVKSEIERVARQVSNDEVEKNSPQQGAALRGGLGWEGP